MVSAIMPLERTHVPPGRNRTSRGPVYLSAVVYPGVGQMVQRRWLAGVFYAVVFSLCLLMFLGCSAIVIVSYYMIPFNFEGFKAGPLPPKLIGLSFAVTLLVYIANLFDTQRAYRRAASAGRRPHEPHSGMEPLG